MFEYYVLGSPSLRYEKGVMLGREKAYADGHRDLKAHVVRGRGSRDGGGAHHHGRAEVGAAEKIRLDPHAT